MARRNDKGTGLLILLGIVGFIIAKTFEFVMENIVPVGILIGVGLAIFALIKYKDHYDDKKERERNIQNANLKGIRESHEQLIVQIEEYRENTLFKIEQINKDLENHRSRELEASKEIYDPVKAISKLKNILNEEYINNNEIWDLIYDNRIFIHENPKTEFENRIRKIEILNEPKYFIQKENLQSQVKKDLISQIAQNKIEFNQNLKSKYNSTISEVNERIELLTKKLKKKEEEWLTEFQSFKNEKQKRNTEIETIKTNYFKKEKSAIISFYSKIIDAVNYDPNFQNSIEVDFNNETKVLIIEYLLPSIEQFPDIKEMRYIKTRNEFKEINYSERELNNIYEDVTYRIVLDLINFAFENDLVDVVDSIVFNGWSNAINKATGLYNKACILSVYCEKKEFLKINLSEVDPKECFKSLKGISAHKISNLTPVKPIITIEKNDGRFVSAQEVGIDSSTNLASMHWEDFEHLIREIFEQEFSQNGGEVKVTQSSRDGGVDAIAFDPDPIRGGKIVIQAKRYTNIVGVSSVRDLYGTVMNEGATKGILVTTSDYGSDSFNFAKDKPLTLINGGNLLYLLEKHGYNARINIKEARETLKQESTNPNNGYSK